MTRKPIIIAHRGASGYRPEHTLAAYELAIQQGADYIEPDLVATKDGALVARHENALADTTDVAAQLRFATRKTTKVIDGHTMTDWFSEDFTLAELKTLRARERLPDIRPQNTAYDGQYEIPTFQEIVELARGNGVGIYPETKHPSYFDSIGRSLEEPLLRILQGVLSPAFIQSFEETNLRKLRKMTPIPLIRLLAQEDRFELEEIATYADGIGVQKELVLGRERLIEEAHRAGLVVHAWTFRDEPMFRPQEYDAEAEYLRFFQAGVDGVFSDNPDTALRARSAFNALPGPRRPE